MRARSWVAVLAAVCVVGTGCAGDPEAEQASPAASGPVDPGTPAAPAGDTAQRVVGARRAHLVSWAVDQAGTMLGVWARGWGERTPEALAVRTDDGRVSLHRSEPGVASNVVATLPSGWLINTVSHDELEIARVGNDASVHALKVSGTRVVPRSGDVAVVFRNRVLVYRPSDDALHLVRQPPMRWRTSGYVTPGGALLVAGRSGDTALWARFDGRHWSRGSWSSGTSVAVVDGNGEHIAVSLGGGSGDGVDATPVAGLAISDDGGTTWRTVAVPPGLEEALSVAVTTDGTAFVSTGSGPLLRVQPRGVATVVHSLRPIIVAAAGNRLYALETPTGNWSDERVLVSRDHGGSWTLGALPGRPAS